MKCNNLKDKWCPMMKMVAVRNVPSFVGFTILNVRNTKTGNERKLVRYQVNRALKKELGGDHTYLGWCPFCGADIAKEHKKKGAS